MTGPWQLFAITALTMIAFAANSVLGRMGLVGTEIGAGSFAAIRLLSGAVFLTLVCAVQGKSMTGTWRSSLALAVYALAFSYAYIALSAGIGAIIMFAVVQITMLSWGAVRGERMSLLQWTGFVVAIGALIWLVSPGLEAPPLWAAASMAVAGLGWGIYSLLGRGAGDPTAMTTGNFVRTSLIVLPLFGLILLVRPEPPPPVDGIALAILSGAITSGLGYIIWYQVVRHITATRAGIAQLSVPALAAIGGVILLAEPITWRFALSTMAILGGVGLAVLTRPAGSRKAEP